MNQWLPSGGHWFFCDLLLQLFCPASLVHPYFFINLPQKIIIKSSSFKQSQLWESKTG